MPSASTVIPWRRWFRLSGSLVTEGPGRELDKLLHNLEATQITINNRINMFSCIYAMEHHAAMAVSKICSQLSR